MVLGPQFKGIQVASGWYTNPTFFARKEVLEFREDNIENNNVFTKVPSSYDGHSQ